jgi:hypothetical protein
MELKTLDVIGGVTFQVSCLAVLFLGGPNWIVPLSIFVGMWWAVGIYRSTYNYIKNKLSYRNNTIKEAKK